MSEKTDFLGCSFTTWRGDKAKEEQKELTAATSIIDFIESVTTAAEIQERLSSAKSPKYKELHEIKGFESGIMLFSKACTEYFLSKHKTISAEEKKVVDSIVEEFGDLYAEPRKNPQLKLDALIKNLALWLEEYAMTNPNKAETKSFCHALYTMLQLSRVVYSELGMFQKKAASLIGLDVDKNLSAMDRLLTKTAVTIQKLDTSLMAELARKQDRYTLKDPNQDQNASSLKPSS